ncbi:hypothetical protein [Paenibacillus harenae]
MVKSLEQNGFIYRKREGCLLSRRNISW